MTMNSAEYSQFRKCMARTRSENDAEALAAIRRANVLLAKYSLTWDEVFNRVVRVVDPVEVMEEGERSSTVRAPVSKTGDRGSNPRALATDDEDWDRTFEDAISGADGSFLATLEDIHEKWQKSGWLSDRQKVVVRAAAERYAERHPGGRVR